MVDVGHALAPFSRLEQLFLGTAGPYFWSCCHWLTNVLVRVLLDRCVVCSSLRFMVLLKLVAAGSHNSANLISYDAGNIGLLGFSPRIVILLYFAVGFRGALPVRTKNAFALACQEPQAHLAT